MMGTESPCHSLPTPYYEDAAITLYHGDAAELLPLLKADAVVTDPPYGVGIKYGEGYDDARPDYWQWFAQMIDLMRESAPFVAFTHRVAALKNLPQAWDWVCPWTKPYASGSRIGNSPLLPHWEPIFVYGVHTLGVESGQHVSDVFSVSPKKAGNTGGFIGREKWAKGEQATHPCPKPQALLHRLIPPFTKPGQTILDPFAGSGTTLVVAKALGRKSIGIEMQERFCAEIVAHASQGYLFEGEMAGMASDAAHEQTAMEAA